MELYLAFAFVVLMFTAIGVLIYFAAQRGLRDE